MSEEGKKKTVSEIIIERFLKDVDERESMPWQRPYERYNAFNWVTTIPYRGINRLLLPFGEYLTANQINDYNKKHKTDYKFVKGIEWYPVIFFKHDIKETTLDKVKEMFDVSGAEDDGYIGNEGVWSYFKDKGKYFKQRNILRYSMVADRKWFRDSNGECLPSRIETGEVEIVKAKPKEVLENYVKREGIKVEKTGDVPCYIPALDTIRVNMYCKTEDEFYSTCFHEAGHSTGHKSRLNRVEGMKGTFGSSEYAKEECIAEIVACLCCAECGIDQVVTSGTSVYDNNVSYVQAWKKKVNDFGKEFIYIVSQADKAFNFIMGEEI